MTGSFHFCGHVEGLVHEALVERAVAEEGDGDAVFAADLGGERHAGGVGHLGADDAVGAHQAERGVDKVHRAALALGETGGFAQHLGDGALGVHAAGQRVVMAAVGAGEIISLAQGPGGADGAAFVADGGMHSAADLARLGQFEERFLDAADQKHGAVHL